ncbi:kelch-like protein 12 [Arctopsyche grandis]|uniref:kelch-like protein 12 n=1 Tax=Arctopsyche grandis TaxID=121162 RepID=UPI00406D9B30
MSELYHDEVRSRHAINILEMMHSFYEESLLCNCELVVGNDRFLVHKLILVTNSDYFESRINNITSEIILEDCQDILSETVKKAIDFFYLGDVDLELHQVRNLLKFAKMIQARELEKYCLNHLEKIIDNNNFLFITEIANEHGSMRLLEHTKKYVLYNYLELIQNEEFLNISSCQLGELLMSDDLKVTSEEKAFEGLKIWIQSDFESRKEHLNTLLKYIRLPLLSEQFLLKEIKPLCYDSLDCIQTLSDIIEWYKNPKIRSCRVPTLNSTPRMSTKQTIIIVGGNSTDISGEIETCNTSVDTWSTFYNLKNNKNRCFQAVTMDGNLLIIGGNIRNRSTNKVSCLDLATKQTTELEEMQQARELFKATVVDSQVFVFGGRCNDDAHILKSAEMYDPALKSWTSLAPMINKRYNHEIATTANEIYIIGGRLDSENCLNTMEVYNINKDRWTEAPPMAVKRCSFAAVTLGDHIYAIGGFNGTSFLNSVEKFDIKSQTWTEVEQYPQPLQGHKGIAFDDKIICVGGFGSLSVFAYDPKTDRWTPCGSISKWRHHFNILLAPMDLLKIV